MFYKELSKVEKIEHIWFTVSANNRLKAGWVLLDWDVDEVGDVKYTLAKPTTPPPDRIVEVEKHLVRVRETTDRLNQGWLWLGSYRHNRENFAILGKPAPKKVDRWALQYRPIWQDVSVTEVPEQFTIRINKNSELTERFRGSIQECEIWLKGYCHGKPNRQYALEHGRHPDFGDGFVISRQDWPGVRYWVIVNKV